MVIKPLKRPLKLLTLEALLLRIPPNHPKKHLMERDLFKTRAQYNGEKNLGFFLQLLPDQDYQILHDVRLSVRSQTIQMDVVVLTANVIFIIESKNFGGNLFFDQDSNQMIRTIDEKEEGFSKMVPVVRTLEKECFIYRYFFIYLNFKIWGSGKKYMSKITFSTKEIKTLQRNPNVQRVSERSITYTDAFKNKFMDEYLTGKLPRQIFEENGFDVDVIGIKRIEQSAHRWTKAYEKNGLIGLTDSRKTGSGRPLKRELTPSEVIARQEARIKLLEGQVELLKKLEVTERRLLNGSENLEPNKVYQLIYEIIEQNQFKKMTTYFCGLLEVSRSGYYSYLKASNSREAREKLDLEAKEVILRAFTRRGYKKGSRSIKMILENECNIIFSRKKIQRIMRKYGIVCPHRRPNPYKKIAKATKEHQVVPNKLNREFKQGVPGKVLLTDITYLPYNGNCMAYLSTVKDASTNEILAYHVSDRITLDIATKTIHKLMNNKKIILHKDAFIHSDQGSHYTSPRYQKLLKKYGLGQSMSRRGNCWDNAPQESFFGHLKDDVDYKSCKTLKELKAKINHYMVYYNNYRYQWNLKKMTPIQYRNHLSVA